jgi:deoxyribodipyrimidine photolyase-related protein
MEVSLVFPHQLFEINPCLEKNRIVYLVEENLFFSQYKFHKAKLAYHRASMKFYYTYLLTNGYKVRYIEASSPLHDIKNLLNHFKEEGINKVHLCEVIDDWLWKRILDSSIKNEIYQTPMFLNAEAELRDFFSAKKRMFQTDFYIAQRKKWKILVNGKFEPLGGKWTYDTENRKKYPNNRQPPVTKPCIENQYYSEAKAYVESQFNENYGGVEFNYPSTFDEAKKWFEKFLYERLEEFGVYEDAIMAEETFLHHSILTPMLNNGLLTPKYVIEKTLEYAEQGEIPINSLEGFVRQIIGWREFIRAVYILRGREERTRNFWNFSNTIPKSFYDGTTGIDPIDITIKKTLKFAYNHHIERLMILGNFMLLAECHPDKVYQWFMEMYIDAYDWVMVPNVYGMSQFADGGLMATKPYISGSNYLFKMSDFKKGAWSEIWDALFWHFMNKQRDFFLKNPRLSMLVRSFDKMSEDKKIKIAEISECYLNSLNKKQI